MSFNFGVTPSFGAAPSTTFSFGATTTQPPQTKSAFGGGGTSFGFGATGFGSSTATTSTGFSLGGLSTPTSAPSTFQQQGFGGGFGGQATTGTTASTGFGGFGSGGGAFAAPGTAPAQPGFSFGSFPTQQATSAPSLFSPFTTTPAFSGFGTKLGAGTTQPTTFTNFGMNTQPQQTGFGQQQQQQAQQPVPGLDPIYNSVFNCCIYGDERDEILSKFNLLQACWGTGKGFYAGNTAPVEYTPQNPLCRFKAIVYSIKPSVESKEGIIAIQFNKKEEEIRWQEAALVSSLVTVLGSRPNLSVHIDSIRPCSDSSTVVFLYVEEKAPTGQTRRVGNSEVCSYLLQGGPKQQLASMGVVDLYPYSIPDKDQIQEYLDNAPPGINPVLWKQSQVDNPDSDKYIPVPVVGFSEVKWRYQCQLQETKRHQAFLDRIAEEIGLLQRENEAARLKIIEYRHKAVDLEHRILKVMVRQEVTKELGSIGALRPDEEILRSQLDTIQSQLNSPQFKGRLSELLSQIRMQRQEASQQDSEGYNMTSPLQNEIKQFLSLEQSGIRSLVELLHQDMSDLKIIREDLLKITGATL